MKVPHPPHRRRFSVTGIAAAAALLPVCLLVAGCDAAGGRLQVTPERLYADTLVPPAERLNPKWQELGRQTIAYSIYRKGEHVRRGRAELLTFFEHEARKAIKPAGPCSVIAGVAYGLPQAQATPADKKSAAGEKPAASAAKAASPNPAPAQNEQGDREPLVRMKVLYLCRQHHALPLKNTDKLPRLPVKGWSLGTDGLAAAQGLPAGAAGSAQPKVAAADGSRPSAPATDTAAPAGGNDQGEQEPDLPDPPPATGEEAGHVFYLAANGLLVKIWSAAPLDAPETKAAVAAIRERLAASVAMEEQRHRELLATTGKHERKVRVRQFWDPNADVYWRLLDFAIGGTIYKTKY